MKRSGSPNVSAIKNPNAPGISELSKFEVKDEFINPQFGIASAGTLSNIPLEGEEIINAQVRRVEEGLPFVGRNIGPIAPFSGI